MMGQVPPTPILTPSPPRAPTRIRCCTLCLASAPTPAASLVVVLTLPAESSLAQQVWQAYGQLGQKMGLARQLATSNCLPSAMMSSSYDQGGLGRALGGSSSYGSMRSCSTDGSVGSERGMMLGDVPPASSSNGSGMGMNSFVGNLPLDGLGLGMNNSGL